MKTISVLIPTYNEEQNIGILLKELVDYFNKELPNYLYELMVIDNHSLDHTKEVVKNMAIENSNIKAIFNAKNFGGLNSPYYGMMQTSGDCTILMCADFQDPISMIKQFVSEWENGYKIVIGRKTKSKENRFVYLLRTCYYKLIKNISNTEQIEHFTGFGLYDKQFIEVLRGLDDPMPYLRGIVAAYGYDRKEIAYEQPKRLYGKTSTNFMHLYDVAMLGITSSSKVVMRLATMIGFICAGVCLVITLIYLFYKILFWGDFQLGMAPIVIGTFFLGSLQLFFIGLLGEYILSINARVLHRPLVVEEERINC